MTQFSTSMQNQMLHETMSALDFKPQIFPEVVKKTRHFSTGSDVYASGGYDYVMKIILLGDQGVGKSSLLKALKVHPDVIKAKCKCRVALANDHLEVEVVTRQGKTALIRLCDTGGQERYRSLTTSYYRGAHGVLLMFDLRSKNSLQNMETWLSDLETFSSASTCIRVLLGSNCASPDRQVTTQDARKYAESRSLPYMEFDTSQYYNVVESLQLIVDRIALEVTISPTCSSIITPCRSREESTEPIRSKFVCLC